VSPLLTLYLDQFLLFVLVLTRVGSLLMALPVLGTSSVPWQVRALLAVTISLMLTPLYFGQSVPHPENLLALAMLLSREAIVGLALGLAVMILLSGMQLAGQVVSQISGLSLADVVNPNFDTSVPIFSHLLELLALAIFFLVGGHREVLAALLGSFAWMPPGSGQLPNNLVHALIEITAQSFEVGIRASAPVMVALVASTLVVGLISRTLPQLNAVAVGLNFNSLIVLGILAVSLGSAAFVFQDELQSTIDLVGQAFLPAS
jgi:flagellar biosynthetic protein FliR